MKRLLLSIPVIAFLALLHTLPGWAQGKAPNFSLKTFDGKKIELAKLKGKVVLVNFWATWCGPCRREIPDFLEAYAKYREKGFEIIGISLDQGGWDVVKPYMERTKITYPVVIDDGSLAQKYGALPYIPVTILVDRKGNILSKHQGLMFKEEIERTIAKAME